MAYTTATFNLRSQSPLESNFNEWTYTTADSEATVKGAGYVSDATNKGVKVGDIVWVVNQATPAAYILQVSAISGGAATVAASVVIT